MVLKQCTCTNKQTDQRHIKTNKQTKKQTNYGHYGNIPAPRGVELANIMSFGGIEEERVFLWHRSFRIKRNCKGTNDEEL